MEFVQWVEAILTLQEWILGDSDLTIGQLIVAIYSET